MTFCSGYNHKYSPGLFCFSCPDRPPDAGKQLLSSPHWNLSQILHMDTLLATLLYLQLSTIPLQQIIDTVKIKLNKANPDSKLPLI